MGRPIKKSFFGPTDSGNVPAESTAGLSFGIVMTAFIPASTSAGYISGEGGSSATASTIVRQTGVNKYVVTNAQGVGRVKLVNDDSPAEGEGYLVGYEVSAPETAVAIKKLTAKFATDFSNARYTWTTENDSTADIIILTAV